MKPFSKAISSGQQILHALARFSVRTKFEASIRESGVPVSSQA